MIGIYVIVFNIKRFNINNLPELFIYLLDKKGNVIIPKNRRKIFLFNDIIVIKLYPETINKLVKEIYFSEIIKVRIKILNREKDNENNCHRLFKDGDENKLHQQSLNQSENYDPDDLEIILKKQESFDLIRIGNSTIII